MFKLAAITLGLALNCGPAIAKFTCRDDCGLINCYKDPERASRCIRVCHPFFDPWNYKMCEKYLPKAKPKKKKPRDEEKEEDDDQPKKKKRKIKKDEDNKKKKRKRDDDDE